MILSKNWKILTTNQEERKKEKCFFYLIWRTNFLLLTRKKEKKIGFYFANFQTALSQLPNVRLTFFKNLDRWQESNLNSSHVNTSSDYSRLTSRSIEHNRGGFVNGELSVCLVQTDLQLWIWILTGLVPYMETITQYTASDLQVSFAPSYNHSRTVQPLHTE